MNATGEKAINYEQRANEAGHEVIGKAGFR
jgi:hypothetical protein